MIKKLFSVVDGFDSSDEKEFWLRKSPLERLEAIELMRQILYNYDPTSARLQRISSMACSKPKESMRTPMEPIRLALST